MQYSLSLLSITLTLREEQIGVNNKSLFLAAKNLIKQVDGSNPGSVKDVLIQMVYFTSSWKRVNNFCLFST